MEAHRLSEPEPEPEPEPQNILHRHMQVWLRESADAAGVPSAAGAKEHVAAMISTNASAEGAECERFVKRSAAMMDHDRANPLLFIGTVKDHMAKVVQALLASDGLTDSDVPPVAARAALYHVGLEFGCVRPLLGRITRVARRAGEKEEAFLKTQRMELKTKAVAEYMPAGGAVLAPHATNPAAWEAVVSTFDRELQKPLLPSQVLRQLQSTVEDIRRVAESASEGAAVLSEETVTQLLCYVVVQSDVQWLRSIHLVVKELSDPAVIDPSGVVDVGSATWCYRVFSNALLVIEGMTVSMQLSDSQDNLAALAARGSAGKQGAASKNSVWRHFTTAAQDERHPNAPSWLVDDEVMKCMGCPQHFNLRHRRHHCRHCGNILCAKCTEKKTTIPHLQYRKPVRVCATCFDSIELIRNPPTGQAAAEAEVERILQAKGEPAGNAVRNFIQIFDERIRTEPATVAIKTREVMDAVRQLILDGPPDQPQFAHQASLQERTIAQDEGEAAWTLQENLTRLINLILEKRLFLPLREPILNCLTAVHYQEEIELERALILIQGRPQELFDIPEKNRSSSNWAAAISHFNQLRKVRTAPTMTPNARPAQDELPLREADC